jgi:cytochrome c biogenesis protein CcmG/thiol:disulfide interchange protein DsbE
MAIYPSPHPPFLNRTSCAIFSSIGVLAVVAVLIVIIAGFLHPNSSNTPQQITASHKTPQPATTTANPSPTQVVLHASNTAPNFTLSTLAGDRTVSLSDYRGKPVLLNFWSLQCPDCLKETPALQKFYLKQRATGKDLVILGINLDLQSNFTSVARFQEQYNITYPIIVDDKYQARTLYNLTTIPTFYFIDRRDIIRSIVVGSLDDTTLHKDSIQIG